MMMLKQYKQYWCLGHILINAEVIGMAGWQGFLKAPLVMQPSVRPTALVVASISGSQNNYLGTEKSIPSTLHEKQVGKSAIQII